MRTDDALRLLDVHQQRILALVEAVVPLLDRGPDEVRAELARHRWTLIRLLGEYKLFKHNEIFDPALASGDARVMAAAGRMKAACIAIGDRFRAHTTRWSTCDVAREWPGYRSATLALVAELRAHVARERDGIAALVGGAARTRRVGR